jgi:hypothetical protein
LSQAFSSWTTCDPHHTGLGFKFQTVVCTLCIMCDVPSITVYCGESTECFLGVASRFFLKPLVNIPVPAIILHFKLHVHCITIHKILYFGFFSPSFCTTFLSLGIATSISMHVFSFVFDYVWPFFCVFSVCVYCLIPLYCNSFLFIHWLEHVCVCTICLLFQCQGLCILSNANVHKLYCVSLSIHSLPKWIILRLRGQ